jgi:thymidylate kinase
VALATVAALFGALNREDIRYCHWKSNLRLARGLSGGTDLDILVDPADAARFRAHLGPLRIRGMLAPPGKRYPGIEDYLGFDPAGGALFHLHVHYRLVLGEQFVKNYQLPLEKYFLDSAHSGPLSAEGIRVPAPELELMVLSLRALLKYRDRDGVKDLLAIRSPGLPAHILEELHWLLARTTPERVREATADLLGPGLADTVGRFLRTVGRPETVRDGRELLRLRQAARAGLRQYQRGGRAPAMLRYAHESARRRNRFRFQPPRKMTLPGKGLTIALVGADGAGKTTVGRELKSWLGRMTQLHAYYLGSKQPSRLSDWLYVAFRAGRRAHRGFTARFGEENAIARTLAGGRQACLYAHYLSVGMDRYRRHHTALQTDVPSGALVLYDRFPLEAPLDGPQIHIAAGGDDGFVARALARREEALYRRFQPPDLFLVLAVDPDISVQRKPDHDRETIEAKARLLRRLVDESDPRLAGSQLVVIDAGQPLDCVLAEAREAIWACLVGRDDGAEAQGEPLLVDH